MRNDKEVPKDHYRKPAIKIEGKIKEFEIAEVDQEIDARVHALYGLDAEEMRVVGGECGIFRCE